MKALLVPALIAFALLGGCCSSQQASNSEPGESASRNGGTSIKRNGATVEAAVESVQVIDDTRYRLFVRVSEATAVEGMDSPSSGGQRLVLEPGYATDTNGNMDPLNPRNQRLLGLRSAKAGDRIRATISLIGRGWVIVDAGNP